MNNNVFLILILLYIIFVFVCTFFCYLYDDECKSCCKSKEHTPIKQNIDTDIDDEELVNYFE